jgi:hypothetical protein
MTMMSEPNGQIVGVTSFYETGPDGQLVPVPQNGQRVERPRRTLGGYRERRMVRSAGQAAEEMMVTLRQTTESRIEENQKLSRFRRSLQPVDQYEAEQDMEAIEDCHDASGDVIKGLADALNERMRKWGER